MKATSLIIASLFVSILSFGQAVSSSCETTDSIKDLYNYDINQLAMRQQMYMDVPYVDTENADKIMEALAEVLNATDIPDTDKIVNSHVWTTVSLTNVSFGTDTSSVWMKELEKGNLVTGNAEMDEIIATYNLSIGTF